MCSAQLQKTGEKSCRRGSFSIQLEPERATPALMTQNQFKSYYEDSNVRKLFLTLRSFKSLNLDFMQVNIPAKLSRLRPVNRLPVTADMTAECGCFIWAKGQRRAS